MDYIIEKMGTLNICNLNEKNKYFELCEFIRKMDKYEASVEEVEDLLRRYLNEIDFEGTIDDFRGSTSERLKLIKIYKTLLLYYEYIYNDGVLCSARYNEIKEAFMDIRELVELYCRNHNDSIYFNMT